MEIPSFFLIFSCCLISAVSNANEASFEPISDFELENDMKAVERAIQSPWVEQFPSGAKRMETKRESFSLTEAQKALFNRHWELETIQREKPTAPKQFDLEMFADALKLMLEMDPGRKSVLLWPHKLREWLRAEKPILRVEGNVENKMPEMGDEMEEEKKSAQLTNLTGQKGVGDNMGEEQCSEADKPKILVEQNDGPSNQTDVQMPLAAIGMGQDPPQASIEAVFQQGNYVNGVDGFGHPMVLIMAPPNNIGNGFQQGKLESVQIEHQQEAPNSINIGDNWEGKRAASQLAMGIGNDGIMYVVDKGNARELAGKSNGLGKNKQTNVGKNPSENVAEREDDANEGKKKVNEEEEEKNKKEETADEGNKNKNGNSASSEEGNEKTVFEAIRGLKKQKEIVQNEEDGNGKGQGRILIIDWAKGPAEEEDVNEEDEEGKEKNEDVIRKLGAMKIKMMEEEKDSNLEGMPRSTMEVEVIKSEENTLEEMEKRRNGNQGFLSILSDMLFARNKRDIVMKASSESAQIPTMGEQMPSPLAIPIVPDGVFANKTILANDEEKEEDDKAKNESEEKKRTFKMVRSLMGRVEMGKKQFGITAKWEMTVNVPHTQEQEVERPEGDGIIGEKTDEKKEVKVEVRKKEGKDEEEEFDDQSSGNINKNEENVDLKHNENGKEIVDEKAELVKYLEWYLVKTGGTKRAEKLAYVLYSELHYWLAKQIEKKFGGDGKDVPEILYEMPRENGEMKMAYLRAKWSITMTKLSTLTKWIGKDFRRK